MDRGQFVVFCLVAGDASLCTDRRLGSLFFLGISLARDIGTDLATLSVALPNTERGLLC